MTARIDSDHAALTTLNESLMSSFDRTSSGVYVLKSNCDVYERLEGLESSYVSMLTDVKEKESAAESARSDIMGLIDAIRNDQDVTHDIVDRMNNAARQDKSDILDLVKSVDGSLTELTERTEGNLSNVREDCISYADTLRDDLTRKISSTLDRVMEATQSMTKTDARVKDLEQSMANNSKKYSDDMAALLATVNSMKSEVSGLKQRNTQLENDLEHSRRESGAQNEDIRRCSTSLGEVVNVVKRLDQARMASSNSFVRYNLHLI